MHTPCTEAGTSAHMRNFPSAPSLTAPSRRHQKKSRTDAVQIPPAQPASGALLPGAQEGDWALSRPRRMSLLRTAAFPAGTCFPALTWQ